jgi:CelD/BcsL family acetyltransferase involved in cellulose biosynthesis
MSGPPARSGAAHVVEFVDVHDPAWTDFVAGHPEATCFHQPPWVDALVSAYGFRARVAVQRDASGVLLAGAPLVEVRRPTGARRWSCLPFSDECAPLVRPGGSVAALLVHVDALRRARDIVDLEVRTGLEIPGAWSRQVAVTHALHLGAGSGGGAPLPRPRPSVRRHVRSAGRLGVRVDVAESADDVLETYYRLHVQTRHRQGVPPQPRRYFRLLWERMIEPGHGFVLIARHGAKAVAGAVYLVGGRTITYKYGASDAGAWSLRPNHAVMAHAIAWATERGFTTFDFGRTDLDNPGLVQFKESWGAQGRPLYYTSFSGPAARRDGPPLNGFLTRVLQRSPSIVCRGLGELFYRYAA